MKRLYRRLLWLYPAEFRSEFATEMQRQFSDEYRDAAGRAARRRFLLRALVDVLTTAPFELARGLRRDLRHALRVYRKSPGITVTAVAVLAVAMAFVGAFLSLYVDLALDPHPGFQQSSRLITIKQNDGARTWDVPGNLIERMSREMISLDAVAAVKWARRSDEGVFRDDVELVSRSFFEGIRPKLHAGRGFEPAEHGGGAEPVAVISYRYWQDELHGRNDVIGTTLELTLSPSVMLSGPDGRVAEWEPDPVGFRIVGILSSEVPGIASENMSVMLPLERAAPIASVGPGAEEMFLSNMALAIGRRSDGASVDAVTREIEARYPPDADLALQPGTRLDAIAGIVEDINVQRASKRQLRLFLAGSLLLAFVAAANVSLFLLARAPGRRRELAVRMSVGAPMRRLARQLASEAGLLVVVAAALGLLMSVWLGGFLRGLAILRDAEWGNVSLLDWRVLSLFGVVLLLLTLLVSLAPILGLKRLGISASSRLMSAQATPAQRIAGLVQIAIAGMLGGAAIASGWYLGSTVFAYPGYETENRYVVRYFAGAVSAESPEFRRVLRTGFTELQRRRDAIEAIPGVSAIAFGRPVPGIPLGNWGRVRDPADTAKFMEVRVGSMDSRYIDVLGLKLLQGRAPRENEFDVVLVNESFARTYWGRTDVVGESVPLGPETAPFVPRTGISARVIGVLEDLSFGHPSADAEPILYGTQDIGLAWYAIVETTLTPSSLRRELDRIRSDIEFEVTEVTPLGLLRSKLIAADRARGILTFGAAIVVIVLAACGFYGTQRYLVGAGRREYAIRAALGAGPGALGRLVLGRGLKLGLPGLVVGALLAFILVAWMRDDFLSNRVSPGAVTFGVLIGMSVLLVVASIGPARRARRTQPAPLLSEE